MSRQKKRGNGEFGINVFSAKNRIGSQQPGQNNIVSDNGINGIGSVFRGAYGNEIIGNFVGTDITGKKEMGNRNHGISIETSSFNNLVNGNLACGSSRGGIVVWDPSSSYNTIVGNSVSISAYDKESFRPRPSPGQPCRKALWICSSILLPILQQFLDFVYETGHSDRSIEVKRLIL